ncbi:hypothetical protein AAFC00_005937 [Neodothiora populina]|uniref:Ribosomal protein S2 n=1 Tax=Neodothiora populina TaxID=2781224 RepID=A0ABR3P6J2_9PEZI
MILRSAALRHGRRGLTNPSVPLGAWTRQLASHTESTTSTTTADSLLAAFEDQQFVEGGIGGDKSQAMHNLPSRLGVQADASVARDYHEFQRQKKLTQSIGSTIAPHYQPHTLLSNPPSPADMTLELLLASQTHLGHATSLWNPANARYIFGVRQGIHIISLDATASHLRRACSVVKAVSERGGLVLFVGTREGQDRAVVKAAEMAGGCHLFDRWIPGSITNGLQILGRCGIKVVDELDKEVPGFEEQLEDGSALKPDLVVCLNPMENYVLLHECGLNNIPTIGVIDTDANPTWVTYPIPANDDSIRACQVIAGALGRAGQQGQERRLAEAKRGIVTYDMRHRLKQPTEAGLTRQSEVTFDPNLPESHDPHRDLTTSTDLEHDANLQSDVDINLIAAFEYAKFADFSEAGCKAAVEMFSIEHGSQSDALEELKTKLQNSRAAHNIRDKDSKASLVASQRLDPDTAFALEEQVSDMLDEPMTTEEAASLHAKDGGRGENIYEGHSYRYAMELRRNAEDAALRRMVALKRRDHGEELSDADRAELSSYDAELKK